MAIISISPSKPYQQLLLVTPETDRQKVTFFLLGPEHFLSRGVFHMARGKLKINRLIIYSSAFATPLRRPDLGSLQLSSPVDRFLLPELWITAPLPLTLLLVSLSD